MSANLVPGNHVCVRTILLTLLPAVTLMAGGPYGSWKMDTSRSTFSAEIPPKSLTVRIESHAKGQVFTLDRIEHDGRATSDSALLYLDGKERDFGDGGCSGSQASRQIDSRTVEIVRKCAAGTWTRFVWRVTDGSTRVLEITERQRDGRQAVRRVVLEKR